MTRKTDHPILLRKANLVWYAVALLPLLVLLYFSFSGALPPLAGLISLFLFFFWLISLGFALHARIRKPPSLRQ